VGKNDKEVARSKFAVFAAAAAMVIIGFALSVIVRDTSSPLDLGRMFVRTPGRVVILTGLVMVVISVITLMLRNQMGLWGSRLGGWIADFFPDWQHLSGVPDEETERAVDNGRGRRLVVIAAAIDLCVGICLIGVGLVLNTGP
jgi:MFS family permease